MIFLEEKNCTENTDFPGMDPNDIMYPANIQKFVDKLPIPKVLIPDSQEDNYDYYEVEMKCAKHKFHRDFNETVIYGYNGMYPGPTFETMKGHTVKVKWINNLPVKHFLPVDKTLHGAIGNPEVRSVVHLHGHNVAPDSDGHPEAWFSRNNNCVGPKYTREVYEYPNQQQATTLWYHDHALGITRLNVYAGLAGFYIIHDFNELSLDLPKGKYDIPLIIQDKTFKKDGSLFYPEGDDNSPLDINPSIVRNFFHYTMVVNGKVWPYLEVEPRKYRFRILNASNTNGYIFKLSNGQSFWQIGTDGGMIDESQSIEKFPLDSSERIDLIIDFSNLQPGDKIKLQTEEPLPPLGPGPEVMEFRVVPLKGNEDNSVFPLKLRPFEKLKEKMAIKTRRIVLSEETDMYGRIMLTLNDKMFGDPATETPEYDSIEIWEIAHPLRNPPIIHPIHLHLVQFQILNRQLFNFQTSDLKQWIKGDPSNPGIDYIPFPPDADSDPRKRGLDPSELGWKDTVRVEPGPDANTGKVTRIIVHFKNFTGDYVWHCHRLEHEDHDMMRPLRVIKKYCD